MDYEPADNSELVEYSHDRIAVLGLGLSDFKRTFDLVSARLGQSVKVSQEHGYHCPDQREGHIDPLHQLKRHGCLVSAQLHIKTGSHQQESR
jgi:hypothetical protein